MEAYELEDKLIESIGLDNLDNRVKSHPIIITLRDDCVREAAIKLGIPERTFYRYIQKCGDLHKAYLYGIKHNTQNSPDIIHTTLVMCDNNRRITAKTLGMSERTFYRKLKLYNI